LLVGLHLLAHHHHFTKEMMNYRIKIISTDLDAAKLQHKISEKIN